VTSVLRSLIEAIDPFFIRTVNVAYAVPGFASLNDSSSGLR
jgi:hypothetical protein